MEAISGTLRSLMGCSGWVGKGGGEEREEVRRQWGESWPRSMGAIDDGCESRNRRSTPLFARSSFSSPLSLSLSFSLFLFFFFRGSEKGERREEETLYSSPDVPVEVDDELLDDVRHGHRRRVGGRERGHDERERGCGGLPLLLPVLLLALCVRACLLTRGAKKCVCEGKSWTTGRRKGAKEKLKERAVLLFGE